MLGGGGRVADFGPNCSQRLCSEGQHWHGDAVVELHTWNIPWLCRDLHVWGLVTRTGNIVLTFVDECNSSQSGLSRADVSV